MAAVFLISMVFTIGIGQFLDRDSLTIAIILTFTKLNLEMVLFNFALIPLAVLVGIIAKNVVAPIVLGIIYLVCSALISKPAFNVFTVGCLPSLFFKSIMQKLGGAHPLIYYIHDFEVNMNIAYITLFITFTLSSVVCILYFRYSEVK